MKSVVELIKNAEKVAEDRNWDTIYWAIDLHGVCFKSNYENSKYLLQNQYVIEGLKKIKSDKRNKIIIWSSAFVPEQMKILNFFSEHGVTIDYFNYNPEIANTETGCFEQKFYMNIILDDKAGFDPNTDWKDIIDYYTA